MATQAGDQRCHGENRMDHRPGNSKSVLEPSVRKDAPPRAGLQPEPGCQLNVTGCARPEHAGSQPRTGDRSALPGAKPTTYRTMGCIREHGNLDPSADVNSVGKPTGPARSRTRGGASVVVGARESRGRGRDGALTPPPAQNPASGFPAPGSHLRSTVEIAEAMGNA
jgi:hypothetical protein